MADTAIAISAGTGTNIDTRTEGTNGNHRQVIVIGDPATNAGVAPVDATAGVKVNLGADNDVTVTGTVAVTQSGTWDEVGINDSGNSITVDNGGTFAVQVDGSALTSLQLIDDTVATEGSAVPSKGILMHGRYDSTSPTSVDDGDAVPILTDAGGRPRVIIQAVQDDNGDSLIDNTNNALQTTMVTGIPASTNTIGNVGLVPRTTGGLDIFRSIDIDETEEEIKATAGQLFSITAFNTTATPLYLKFYNATAASVTVGTTTPVLTYMVPANADSDGAGFIWNNEIGFAFSTAMTVACTTGIADNDTGAPSANACIINVGYK